MAHYGISAGITAKVLSKREPGVEKAILQWVFDVLGEPVPEGVAYEDALKDGVALCKLINKLNPNANIKFNTGTQSYKLMENIDKFLKACQEYGVPHDKLFPTVALFEKKNVAEVTGGLIALARQVQNHPEWAGPQVDKWVFANN